MGWTPHYSTDPRGIARSAPSRRDRYEPQTERPLRPAQPTIPRRAETSTAPVAVRRVELPRTHIEKPVVYTREQQIHELWRSYDWVMHIGGHHIPHNARIRQHITDMLAQRIDANREKMTMAEAVALTQEAVARHQYETLLQQCDGIEREVPGFVDFLWHECQRSKTQPRDSADIMTDARVRYAQDIEARAEQAVEGDRQFSSERIGMRKSTARAVTDRAYARVRAAEHLRDPQQRQAYERRVELGVPADDAERYPKQAEDGQYTQGYYTKIDALYDADQRVHGKWRGSGHSLRKEEGRGAHHRERQEVGVADMRRGPTPEELGRTVREKARRVERRFVRQQDAEDLV